MKRISTLLLFVVALSLLASGCIWGQRSKLSILAGAREQALENQTVHFELTTSVEGLDDASAAGDIEFKAHGATDSASKKGFFIMEVAGLEVEWRTLDGASYMRLFGDSWTELDTGDEDFGLFSSDFDPFELLEQLGVNDTGVTYLGSGEVRGKKAERYGVSLDAADLNSGALFSTLPGDTKITLEVWIGSDGMPARLSYAMAMDPGEIGIENSGPVKYTLTLDLFDYGKPVDVGPPPADKIMQTPGLGSLGGLDDPFEGADCYGERLADCLQPDPATDALASDPAVCQGRTARVCLVPVGKVRPDVVQAIIDFHRDTRGIDVVVLPGLPVPPGSLHEEDSQVTAEGLYRAMQSAYGASDSSASTFIAITSIDAVPEAGQYGWEFGARFGRGSYGNLHGAFSYFRMANVKPYSGAPLTDDLLHLRVAKYVGRYTAILSLHHNVGADIRYLNYHEMYGFSDLDSMGTAWPPDSTLKPFAAPTCTGESAVICVIPDGKIPEAFLDDIKTVVKRLAAEGLPVELYLPRGVAFVPTQKGWGVEFSEDLASYYANDLLASNPGMSIIGVSDDSFVQDPEISPHFEFFRPPSRVGVVSVGDAVGTYGTVPHQERLYRMMVRVILQVRFNQPLSEDQGSIMWKGARSPSDLDAKSIPPIPK